MLKGFVGVVGWMCLAVVGLALVLIGWHLSYEDKNAKPVMRESATMFSIIVASLGALVVGQLEANRIIWPFVVAFILISLANISGMVYLLMAKSTAPPEKSLATTTMSHAYDWASILFTRSTLVASMLMSGLFIWLAMHHELPGQTVFGIAKKAELGEAYRYEFKFDKTEGVIVPVSLDRKIYPKGIPAKLIMEITFRDSVAKHWEVAGVEGVIGLPLKGGKPMMPPPAEYEKSTEPNKRFWYLNGLTADESYTLSVLIHGKKDRGPVDELLNAIREKGITVSFHSHDEK